MYVGSSFRLSLLNFLFKDSNRIKKESFFSWRKGLYFFPFIYLLSCNFNFSNTKKKKEKKMSKTEQKYSLYGTVNFLFKKHTYGEFFLLLLQ